MGEVRNEVTTCSGDDASRLFAAIAADDTAAFRQFFHCFAPEVLALCKHILKRHEDAEDVTSEVFWELWKRRKDYDTRRSSPRTYLMMLARSRAIDRLRSKADMPVCLERSSETHEHADSPSKAATLAELRVAAIHAVNLLDDSQRQALSLAFFHGLSHQEIAARLDRPLGTVKSDIRRGLQRLQHPLRGFQSEGNND